MRQTNETKSFLARCYTALCCCCCKDEQSYQPVNADGNEAQEIDGAPVQPSQLGGKKVVKKDGAKSAEGTRTGSGHTAIGMYLIAAVQGGEKLPTAAPKPSAEQATSSATSDLANNPLFASKASKHGH